MDIKDNIYYLDDYREIKKQPIIVINIKDIINMSVDLTLLNEQADSENIKIALYMIIDKYKNDYEDIIIQV